ncbi:MAG: transporter [Acidobacteria bacterium]|nr:transporter [Acidobacteriota bacterium]
MTKRGTLAALILLIAAHGFAQMDTVFEDIFTRILITELQLSPGAHANHFVMAAEEANSELTPALNSLIASQVSSFPAASTAVGVTFDFSSGQPVKVTDSQGPVFGEIADTLGKGKLSVGITHNELSLDRLRGVSTRDVRFTFTHVDVTGDGLLGESPNESDTIDVLLDLDLNASITALYASYGLTPNLDVGVAIPFVSVSMDGIAQATINSYTFAFLGTANHNFNNDPTNPQLQTTVPYSESASGIGDVALKLKMAFLRGGNWDLAMGVDVRLSTGDESDFLGTGDTNIRFAELLSRRFGDFRPHVNVAYEWRGADLDADELEFAVGFDHKATSKITIAADFMGSFDVDDSESIQLFPGSVTITDHGTSGVVVRHVDRSNVPERSNDDVMDGSFGIRYAPKDNWSIVANLLVPLNDGGLRSKVVPTIGVSAQF